MGVQIHLSTPEEKVLNVEIYLNTCKNYIFANSLIMFFKIYIKEAVQLSEKLRLFNSKFCQEFDGVNICCQKLALLA